MRQAGFRRDDPVYPDLAYSYPVDDSLMRRDRSLDSRVVGLSPMCYCHPRYWPRKDGSVYTSYLRKLCTIVKWLVKEQFHVSIFASDSPDRFAIDDLWELLSIEMPPEDLSSIERHDVRDVGSFLERISRVDLMVASRLHSVLLSQLIGTPAIALSYDRRVHAQMESVGQSSFCLSLETLQVSQFQERFMKMQANLDAARREIRAHFAIGRAKLEVQYDAIVRSRYQS